MKTNTALPKTTCPKTMAARLRTACATRVLPLLLFLALPAALQAEDYTYTTNVGAITITGYTGPGGAVTIPSTINGLPVTSIGDQAFMDCFSLTSMTIPNTVTNIGTWAFLKCTSLANLAIPASVTTIGTSAFIECTSLTSMTISNGVISIGPWAFAYCGLGSVTIPNSVTSIGVAAFARCWDLNEITVDALNPFYGSLAGVLFNTSQTTLIQCPGGKGGYYTVPNSVTGIGPFAFGGCTGLAGVAIPPSVTNIGSRAFIDCLKLGEIAVDTLNPFYSSVDGVLFDMSQTTLIQYPAGKAGASYTIPNSVTSIGDSAFENTTSLTSVTIPNSVTSIESYAFNGCSSLAGVFFHGDAPSLGSFGSTVFDGDNNATVYFLPGTTGWTSTFGGRPAALWYQPVPYTYTTNVGVITITGYTGPGGAVTIPSTINGLPVTSIGDYAFEYSYTLTSVTIPDSVTSIGNAAFDFCTGLRTVTIGNSVTNIASHVFYYCTSLTSITIGDSVTNIGTQAFSKSLFKKSVI